MMQPRRRGDHRRVDLARQTAVVRHRPGVALGGDAVPGFRPRIDDGDQFDAGVGGGLLGVKSTESSGADHGQS